MSKSKHVVVYIGVALALVLLLMFVSSFCVAFADDASKVPSVSIKQAGTSEVVIEYAGQIDWDDYIVIVDENDQVLKCNDSRVQLDTGGYRGQPGSYVLTVKVSYFDGESDNEIEIKINFRVRMTYGDYYLVEILNQHKAYFDQHPEVLDNLNEAKEQKDAFIKEYESCKDEFDDEEIRTPYEELYNRILRGGVPTITFKQEEVVIKHAMPVEQIDWDKFVAIYDNEDGEIYFTSDKVTVQSEYDGKSAGRFIATITVTDSTGNVVEQEIIFKVLLSEESWNNLQKLEELKLYFEQNPDVLDNKNLETGKKQEFLAAYEALDAETRAPYDELVQHIKRGGIPTITAKQTSVSTTVGNDIDWKALVQATDNEDGNITLTDDNFTVSEYDVTKVGSYTVTLTVRDSDGNEASIEITLDVQSNTPSDNPNNPSNPDDPTNPSNPKNDDALMTVIIWTAALIAAVALLVAMVLFIKRKK